MMVRQITAVFDGVTYALDLAGYGGDYVVWNGQELLGHATRDRHTRRITYKGKRYGYDRTHTCWHTTPALHTGLRSSWRHDTLQDAARALIPNTETRSIATERAKIGARR